MTGFCNLVEQYVDDGCIDFQSFRRAFAQKFLTTESTDPDIRVGVLSIESECADFSEGLITEAELKRRLSVVLNTAYRSLTSTILIEKSVLFNSATMSVPLAADIKWSLPEGGRLIFAAPDDTESSVVFA